MVTTTDNLNETMRAIEQAQAIITFGLDGTVITANENFLTLMGYELAEVQGKPYRMFFEAAYVNSPEYHAFWAKLKSCQVDKGIRKRMGKEGKELWLHTTCMPVLGDDGRIYSVIEIASDVTAQNLELDELRDELKVRKDIMNTTSIITRHPDMPKEVFKEMWATIGRGQIFRGVVKNKAKDGTPYYVDAVIAPFMGKNGKPRKYLGVRYDITQQEIARQNMKGIVDAIDRSYASIEFNLDGTINTANENFLKTMGYTLEDIKGQHHRMFCDPAYTSSGDYVAFWQRLNRGEFEVGIYRRIGKGGKEVWIQASYNPVKDEMGRPFKVVKFATDITAQKKAQAELEACMNEAQKSLEALTRGDLTQPMEGAYQGELNKIKMSLNAALTNLSSTIAAVRLAVETVTAHAEQITKGNEDLSQRTSEQASALEETSASMEEMTSTVKQNADNAKQANQLAITARETANKGGVVTKRAVDAMGEINKSSKKIADIITVIDEIAFQTNLLALNAAVEAARAGEHGRGFAVVAAEVRNLAQRSATAAKEIKGLINESILRVTEGSDLVNQTGQNLDEIMSSVKRVADIIAEITAASQEQASGIEQVNKAVMSMDEVTQQNAALVEEITSASQAMNHQAQELMQQVEIFTIGESVDMSIEKQNAPPNPGPSKPMIHMASRNAQRNLSKPMSGNAKERRREASCLTDRGIGMATRNSLNSKRIIKDEFEEF